MSIQRVLFMLARMKTLHRVAAALLEHHLQRPSGLGLSPLNYLKHGSIRNPNAEENRRANKKTAYFMSSFKEMAANIPQRSETLILHRISGGILS